MPAEYFVNESAGFATIFLEILVGSPSVDVVVQFSTEGGSAQGNFVTTPHLLYEKLQTLYQNDILRLTTLLVLPFNNGCLKFFSYRLSRL